MLKTEASRAIIEKTKLTAQFILILESACSPSQVADQYAALTRVIAEERANRSVVGGLGFGGAQFSMFTTYALLFW